MANPFRGEASLEAGSKVYTLCISVNALCEAEEVLGVDTDVLVAKYATGTSLILLRGLVWAALQEKHPCSIDEAGEIISVASVVSAKAAVEKALVAAMPEAPKEKNPPKRGRAGTGSSS